MLESTAWMLLSAAASIEDFVEVARVVMVGCVLDVVVGSKLKLVGM